MTKVLLFGGSGLVGSGFIGLNSQGFEIKAPLAQEVDILNKDQLLKQMEEFRPDTVINFAAYTNVEEAENERDDKNGICYKINVTGAKNVTQACRDFNIHLIHISTEYVFNGEKDVTPYNEEDRPDPINWYGQTKYMAETEVLNYQLALVARISMPYTAHYKLKKDIARFFLEQLKDGKQIKAIEDQKITPTLVSDIANALKVFIEKKTLGIYHVSAKDSVTPLELAKTIAETFHLDYSLISSILFDEYNLQKKGKLLKNSWLSPAKFDKEFGDDILHTVEEGIALFAQELGLSKQAVD